MSFLDGFSAALGGASGAPTSLTGIAVSVLAAVLVLLAVIALAALIWGGIVYIISLGNDQDIQKAKKIIIYAIIGIIVVMTAGIIVNVVIDAVSSGATGGGGAGGAGGAAGGAGAGGAGAGGGGTVTIPGPI